MVKRFTSHKWSRLLLAYAALTVLGALLWAVGGPVPFAKKFGFAVAIGCPSLFVLVFFLIAVHELGHLIAAKCVGMRVDGFCVGPFRWLKRRNKWHFSWYDDMRIGGFVLASQVDGGINPKKHAALFLGGPLGSVAAAVAAYFVLLANPDYKVVWGTVFGFALLFTTSLVPLRSGGFGSDGYWLIQLLFKPEEAARQLATSQLASMVRADVPTREWPKEVMATLRSIQGKTMEAVVARIYEISYAFERGDEALVRTAVEELETAYATTDFVDPTSTLKAIVLLDLALAKATLDHDAVRAREILSRVEGGQDEVRYLINQVLAIVLILEGEEDASRAAVDQWQSLLNQLTPDRPRIRAEATERMERILEAAREARLSGALPSPAIPPPLPPSPPPSC
jgi:hypothetical protein